jgi:hypothetical protein
VVEPAVRAAPTAVQTLLAPDRRVTQRFDTPRLDVGGGSASRARRPRERVSVPFVNVGEFADDRYTDVVLYVDQVELLTQLGVVSALVD